MFYGFHAEFGNAFLGFTPQPIGILPANTRYRLVGKASPHLVENCGASGRSRLAAFKQSVQKDVVSRGEPV